MKELLKDINESNILLEVVNGELKVFAGNAHPDPALISRIREKKSELIQFLVANLQHKSDGADIPLIPVAASYPISSAQKRIWVLSQFKDGSAAYNIPGVYVFEGALDIAALAHAFNRLITRHEILRTVFREDETGEIRQFILAPEQATIKIRETILRPEENDPGQLKKLVQQEVAQPFDLATGPLLRTALYQVADNRWIFAYTIHHIISDAWSMGILINELMQFYSTYNSGTEASLPPLRIQYKDYAAWQQAQLTGESLDIHKSWWLKQFEGSLPVLDLPGDRFRPAVRTNNGGMVHTRINSKVSKGLKALCHEQGATLYMGLLTAVKTLLYRYTHQTDIIVGSSVAGRDHIDLEGQIGFYLNILAIRTQFEGENSYRELLGKIKQYTLGAFEHQVYPFDELVEELPLQRDTSRNALFDVIVGLQNVNDVRPGAQQDSPLTISRYEGLEDRFNKFDLTFLFTELGEEIQASIGYNSDIFNQDTIVRLSHHFEQLLEAVLANPSQPVNKLDYLGEAEKQQLRTDFPVSRVDYPADKSVVDLFREQALHTPDQTALVFKQACMSYRELNEQTDRLAAYLRNTYAINNGDLVGVMLDRSADMIIALLAILKSGAGYVAIEPDLPRDRKGVIVKDTNIKALITQSDYIFDLDYYQGGVFAIDIQLSSTENIIITETIKVAPSDLAYVIFTSGSTGQPKGVMVTHRALVDYSFGVQARTNIRDCASFGLVSTIAADLGNTIIYTSLLMGGALHVFSSEDVMSGERMAAANLDCIKIVPSHWKALQEEDRLFAPAKCLIFGGEALTADVLRHIKQHGATCEVYNHYGPSEATIGKLINKLDIHAIPDHIPLGSPFCNSRVYILDEQLQLLPVGVSGEICIGGDGVSTGYLHRPELTAERFVADPFQVEEQLYKTGDIGRWLADGTIVFMGRKDDQVKIRGYRIEPGEIAAALKTYPGIEDAIVLARMNNTGEKELVAYVAGKEDVTKASLQAHLGKTLPSYMLPGYYVQLPVLPLTSNGKIDRKRLPDPEGMDGESGREYVAPRTATEEKLAAIWQEVLGKESIGAKDNFFDLGGHSLKATRLASQIHKTFEVKIEFHDLFTSVVLEDQARLIDQTGKVTFATIPLATPAANYPLSPSQRRLWILSQLDGGSVAYNVPEVYVFEGALHQAALTQACRMMIARHETLRTLFREDEYGEVKQFILPAEAIAFDIIYRDAREETDKEEKIKEWVAQEKAHPFDLSTGPMIRAHLFQLTAEKWIFTFNMHHIISDAWSKSILIKELLVLYNAFINGEPSPLVPLTIQYKDYAVWNQQQLSGEDNNQHKRYWLEKFSGAIPVLELPADYTRPAVKTYNGATVVNTLDKQLSAAIKALLQQRESTLYMGLLALVNGLMYRYTNQEDIIIGSQIAGRLHADLENQVGNYLNTLVLRTRFSGDDSFHDLLAKVKQNSLEAIEHQAYPFDELIEALQLRYDKSRNPLFDVSVVLQNAQVVNMHTLPTLSGIKVSGYEGAGGTISKFDLAFDFIEIGDEIQTSLVYNSDIFTEKNALQYLHHLYQLLKAVISNPDMPLSELNILSEAEQAQQLISFNATTTDYPSESTVVALFEEQVKLTPDNIAVVCGQVQLTYRELDEQSSRLAAYLHHTCNIKTGERVGFLLDRSEHVIIAILGILKCGGVYVPVDTAYPQARKEYILSDTGVRALITQTDYIFDLSWYRGATFAMDAQLDTLGNDTHYAAPDLHAGSLAYVMYTSGSTGTPKGVMVEHRSIVRLVRNTNFVTLNEDTVILSTGAISFDATTFEYWGTLLNGGRLVLCSQSVLLDAVKLEAEIKKQGVNMMWFTSGWLNQLTDTHLEVFSSLHTLLAGGDKLSEKHINTILNTYPGITVINGYGPTENTTFSLTHKITAPIHTIPIGAPISNSTVYIVNNRGRLQPLGAVGEICVGGAGLAQGYLNNEALTAEKFIPHPFISGQLLYKTGDLGRWSDEGNVYFEGRKDDQVKIRGYRIELGEIERALQTCAGVDAAVVVIRTNDNNEKTLVAYLAGSETLTAADIRYQLTKTLPAYMLPAHFVQLDSLPLNPNGKVDKAILPDPAGIELPAGTAYVAPGNETEEKMVLIWQELLGRDRIGITDSFFDLGGDSIKILRMVSEVRKQLQLDIPIAEIYRHNTIENIVVHILNDNTANRKYARLKEMELTVKEEMAALKERILSSPLISGKDNIEDVYPMSDIEKGMIYESLMSEGLGIYHDQLVNQWVLTDFDIDRFRKAMALLVEKHPILRTSFHLEEYEEEVQFVHKKVAVVVPFRDISGLTPSAQEKEVKEFVLSELNNPFVVTEAPLWRAHVFLLNKDEVVFALQFHHAIMDGWSHASITTELNNVYLKLGEDPSFNPGKLKSTYKDFIIQHGIDKKETAIREFWERELSDYKRQELFTEEYEFNGYVQTLDNETLDKLKKTAASLNTSVKVISLSAYLYMLNALSYDSEALTGIVTNNRISSEDGDKVLGCFLNTIPLRVIIDSTTTGADLVNTVHHKLIELKEYERLSLLEIARMHDAVTGNPFFDTFFNYVDFHAYKSLKEDVQHTGKKRSASVVNGSSSTRTNMPLEVSVNLTGDVYNARFFLSRKLKSGVTPEKLGSIYFNILDLIINRPQSLLRNASYVSPEETRLLLSDFNNTTTAYSHDKTITALFEAQVVKTPAACALAYPGGQLTYAALNEAANKLSHFFRKQYEVQPNELIGIKMDRSERLIISILGILKAGAAYVPIDPAYPQERIDYIKEDSKCRLVIDDQVYADFVSNEHAYDHHNTAAATTAADLAYVIYTSGSTGMPKGCGITHRSLNNYIEWANSYYFNEEAAGHFSLFTSLSFDLTVTSIFSPLTRGSELYIYNQEEELTDILRHSFSKESKTDAIKLTPSHISILKLMDIPASNIGCAIVGGEQVTPEHVRILKQINPAMRIYNEYGPTESTVGCVVKELESDVPVLIGKPVANTRIYVLDSLGCLLPVGVVGELCIAGDGLAVGYLHKSTLTAEKFVPDPFVPGARMYRTGDLARWLPDGNLDFIGRKDDQVKIRGYRIELGEIENVLRNHEQIDDVAVLAKAGADGRNELVAYIAGSEECHVAALRTYMAEVLPAYMIPSYFVQLSTLPLTINGKLDKKKLPEPASAGLTTDDNYAAPRNIIEQHLVAVYEEVLKKQPIGIKDDFFALGGDSIKSIQVVARLKQRGYSLSIKDVMRFPVIEQLALQVKAVSRTPLQGIVAGAVPLSPVQAFFLGGDWKGKHHFNQSVLLRSHAPVIEAGLVAALDKIVLHHDALRMVYRENAGVWEQENKGSGQRYSLEIFDYTDAAHFEAECERIQAGIDLSAGPLFKAGLFREASGDRLLLVAHHLVVDGVSWHILLEDLSHLYQQYLTGVSLQLPLKTDSFKYWQEKQLEYAGSESLQQEEAWWNAIAAAPVKPLQPDDAQGSNLMEDAAGHHFLLNETATANLLTKCYKAYRTNVNDVLITALGLALGEVFSLNRAMITMEGHGREDINADVDISRTLGWFTTMYPVSFDINSNRDSIQQLITVKECLHRIPNNGIGYGVLRYMKGKDFNINPDITFNYLGQFDTSVKTDGETPLFELSGEYHGKETAGYRQRFSLLGIVGIIVQGKLRITVTYSNKQFTAATIERFAGAYEQQLHHLVAQLSATAEVYPTPVDLTYKELSIPQVQQLQQQFGIEDVYPLSPLQESLYYHWLRDPESLAYFEQLSYRIKGKLNIAAIAQSYDTLVSRHAILRTFFTQQLGTNSLQVVCRNAENDFVYREIQDDASTLKDFRESDRVKGFDLSRRSQMRLSVLAAGEDTYEFVWSFHHILMDGWCMSILIKEFFEIYYSILQQREPQLPEVAPYASYISWLMKQDSEKSLQYWRNYLAGYDSISALPKDIGPEPGYHREICALTLDGTLRQSIRALCSATGVTENTFMQAVWGILLGKYNLSNDAVFGAVVSGRPGEIKGIEDMIGLFINTVPVRVQTSDDTTFVSLLKTIQEDAIAASDHHYTQLATIQAESGAGRQLFDHIMVFENYPVQEMLKREITSEDFTLMSSTRFEQTNYDFSIIVMPGRKIVIHFTYNVHVYGKAFMERLKGHFLQLITKVVEEPSITIPALDYVSEAEKEQLLENFDNSYDIPYPQHATLTALFEEQAAKTPAQTALVFEERSMNYRELNELSNKLAHYLRDTYDTAPDELIGIQLERSEWMVISILGILKSGAAYVPIDPAYPQERIDYILEDCKCKTVIDEALLNSFISRATDYSHQNPDAINTATSLAYVIYTSGSTGKPKGVMIEHRNVVNLIVGQSRRFGITSADRILQFSALSFDASVEQIFMTLYNGATLVVASDDTRKDPVLMDNLLEKEGITHFHATPSYLETVAFRHYPALKRVVAGGEKCSEELCARWNGYTKFYNKYGPTETTVTSLMYSAADGETLSIGKPVSNTRIYILNDSGMLQAEGIAGEICISGAGVARGYLNQPALTQEKFVPHPFIAGERMYKTGDLGKWLPDGNIAFIGRKDNQVKIRGYRIEPGEIENALLSHEQIDTAVVITQGNDSTGGAVLVAYLRGREIPDATALKAYLQQILPAYMVPAYFVQLEVMPLTVNGKVDRKKLPAPDDLEIAGNVTYTPPRNAIEKQLVAVFREVLKKQLIGIKDDFFALGGDSIKSIQIVSRLRQSGYTLSVRDVMQYPVIEQLAAHVRIATSVIAQETVTGTFGLTPVQAYFFEGNLIHPHHYNQSILLQSRERIAEDHLQTALDKIMLHHDALRIVYSKTPSGWTQENKNGDGRCVMEVITAADEQQFTAHCERIQSSFNLEEGPLFKALLFHNNGGSRLLLAAHHLVIDGVSWRILLEDLSQLYRQYLSGKPAVLPLKTHSFKYWQEQLQAYANSEALQQEVLFWSAMAAVATRPLPLDYPDGSNLVKDAASQSFTLDQELTSRLLTQCHKAYKTDINDILLTAFSTATAEVLGMQQVAIHLEGHGREEFTTDLDITRTVGWFTAMYPVVFDMRYRKDIIRQMIAVKETLHRIPNKGIGYGILKYLVGKDYHIHPGITFNYLGDFGEGVNTEEGDRLFEFSGAYHGRHISKEERRHTILDVSGMVVDGSLRFTITYSKEQYTEKTIVLLQEHYRQQLDTLAAKLSAEPDTHITPVDLTYRELSVDKLEILNTDLVIEDIYPLSPLQEGLYYQWASTPESPAYHSQLNYRVRGNLHIDTLRSAYQRLQDRHAVLRTFFVSDMAPITLQVVRKSSEAVFDYIDGNEHDFSLEDFKAADRERGFDLHTGSQMRLTIVHQEDNTYDFIWSFHHILMDGWCISILTKEFFELYYSMLQQRKPQLPEVVPYASYISWLMKQDAEKSLQYWQHYLSGYNSHSTLPKRMQVAPGYQLKTGRIVLEGPLRQSIRTLCSATGVTENTFIQAVWGLLLGKYNHEDDVVFGAVVSGRPGEVNGIEDMIGLFINTIPVRVQTSDSTSFVSLLKTIQENAIASTDHHYTQLANIQSGRELIDHIMIFENYPVQEMLEQEMASSDELTLLSVTSFEQTNYNFALVVVPGKKITISFEYNAHVYEEAFVEKLQAHLLLLVTQVLAQPAMMVHEIDYVSEAEKQQLLVSFNNDNVKRYPEKDTIIALFEAQAAQTPDNKALIVGARSVTYRELNESANQLAHYLRANYNIQPDNLLGVFLERSEWAIIAMLAILKSGGAYVPIDPEYPEERITYMLADSQCKVVIDEKELERFKQEADSYDKGNPALVSKPHQLAYVIYTSGTTGKPKGVMITHHSLQDYAVTFNRKFNLAANDRVIQQSAYSFDTHVEEIYPVLLSGGAILMSQGGGRDINELITLIAEQGATVLSTTPLVLKELHQLNRELHQLRLLISGGDKFNAAYIADYIGRVEIYDTYGPTESTVCSTYFKITDQHTVSIIGSPIANRSIYILDADHALCSIGFIGEICIGGEGLARGYLNQPALTAQKFIPNPFNEDERLYLTGDLGRWLPDGNIAFIGRKDEQVKVRGYRIEPAEIETALLSYEGIDVAVVTAVNSEATGTILVAYLQGKGTLIPTELRAYLHNILPPYMIPAHFVQLSVMPLTPNGKVDKRKLSAAAEQELPAANTYVAPRNDTEDKLVSIWKDILGKELIGINDSFFSLGGHSLKVTRLASRIQQEFEVKIALRDIFANDTIEQLGNIIQANEWITAPQVIKEEGRTTIEL